MHANERRDLLSRGTAKVATDQRDGFFLRITA
jgi:hypothetical protein